MQFKVAFVVVLVIVVAVAEGDAIVEEVEDGKVLEEEEATPNIGIKFKLSCLLLIIFH